MLIFEEEAFVGFLLRLDHGVCFDGWRAGVSAFVLFETVQSGLIGYSL